MMNTIRNIEPEKALKLAEKVNIQPRQVVSPQNTHLTEKPKKRIVMVGNNVKRNFVDVNCFGVVSVLLH